MADYKKNVIEEVIKVVPLTEFTELHVQKIGNEAGITHVDIRQWYCTQKDPVLKPSTKGIRLKISTLVEVLPVLQSLVQ